MNYFELFEMPVSLLTDKAALAKKYFELQKKYHPDFYTLADEEQQREALERSSLINKAFKVLQQPDLTIRYVLQLKELLADDEKYALPPEFLMELMELNERVMEQNAVRFKQEMMEIENTLYETVKDIIENYRDSTATTENLLKLKEYYFKKKYLHRILDRLDD